MRIQPGIDADVEFQRTTFPYRVKHSPSSLHATVPARKVGSCSASEHRISRASTVLAVQGRSHAEERQEEEESELIQYDRAE